MADRKSSSSPENDAGSSDETRASRAADASPPSSAPGGNAADESAATDVAPDAAGDGFARIAALEAEVAGARDKLLRALAEAENVRRRAEREKEDAFKYAVAGFAREMLPVADNLRRAVVSADESLREGPGKALLEGVEMTERAMLAAFERAGIRVVEAAGKRFDHNVHEVLFEMEDASVAPGTVVQVLETGYTLNDRLLRSAKVALAKGGATAAEGSATGEPAKDQKAKGDGRAKIYDKSSAGPSGGTVDENL
jgi:molecular chaperone GrpE